MDKQESKYFRTAQRMDQAFLHLLDQKDFAYITVKEICQLAGVNRSTFYLHYETIGDILAESIEYAQHCFLQQFSELSGIADRITDCSLQELLLITPDYLQPYLSFIKDNRHLYRTAMKKPEIFAADRTYQKMFQQIFDPILDRFAVPAKERHYRMQFYLNGISGIIAAWLERDCAETVEQISSIIQRCVPGMELLLHEAETKVD